MGWGEGTSVKPALGTVSPPLETTALARPLLPHPLPTPSQQGRLGSWVRREAASRQAPGRHC